MTMTASEMGEQSWKSRKRGKTKKQISEQMRSLANKRYLDKVVIPTRNA